MGTPAPESISDSYNIATTRESGKTTEKPNLQATIVGNRPYISNPEPPRPKPIHYPFNQQHSVRGRPPRYHDNILLGPK
ncbi:hypothetical protein VTJ04DRAFT_1566 [Mycothermus thermophilus]|uniref:uncharacterized protein n=1 Tax=Humicola insolens TaxID=85995 RepID=UPI003742ABF6